MNESFHYTEVNQETGIVTAERGSPSEAPVTMDPTEEAAMKFTKLLPYVKMIGGSINAKGVVRVLHAFAEFPLGAAKPRLLNEAERQLFHILQELSGYKSTVIQGILKQNAMMEQMKQQAVQGQESEGKNESSENQG